MLKFDEEKIARRLGDLSPTSRLVFAAACAERLNAGYQMYAARVANRWAEANAKTFGRAMDAVWKRAAGGQAGTPRIRRLLKECVALMPTQDEFVPKWHEHVESVGVAIAHALSTCLTEEAKDAAVTARVAYNAADEEAISAGRLDVAASGAERQIVSSRVVQEELKRQDRDLRELAAATLRGDDAQTWEVFRRRASKDEARTFL